MKATHALVRCTGSWGKDEYSILGKAWLTSKEAGPGQLKKRDTQERRTSVLLERQDVINSARMISPDQ